MKLPEKKETYAIVTGASLGLGRAYAFELSKRKINTILVGLPNEGLDKLCEALQNTYQVKSVFFETDLSIKDNVLALAKIINENYNVFILINNAGVGGSKEFTKAGVEEINNMIQLNMMAPTLLTHQLLPNLFKQDNAYVLNVSSIAAFSPMGFKTVYPASKAFLYNFSRSLGEELIDSNVFVSVVNPGPMKTNQEVTERISEQGFWGKLGVMSPEYVAEKSIRQLFERKSVILINSGNKIIWLMMKTIPVRFRLPLISNAVKKELQDDLKPAI
jgi:uncharacterized protein